MTNRADYQSGMAALQAGEYARAAVYLARADVVEPDDPAICANLGSALQALGRLDDAIACFDRALTIMPDAAALHFNRGNALKQALRFTEALAAYERALEIAPDDPNFHYNRARALEGLERFADAIASYGRALSLKPEFAEAHLNRGLAHQRLEDHDAAIEDFRKAADTDPPRAEIFNVLGGALFAQSRFVEAAAAFSRAIECDGQVIEFHTNLASAESQAGHLTQARQAYSRALSLDPENAGIRLQLAVDILLETPTSPAHAQRIVEMFDQELTALETWARASPRRLAALAGAATQGSLFCLGYRTGDHTELLRRYGLLLCEAMQASPRMTDRSPAPARRARRGRSRLLVVSAHVRRHSVQDVITQGWLERLDRKRFEVAIGHTSALCDTTTRAAAELADHFVQGPFTTDVWAARIREWRPDVILYPEVGMDPATTALAALRLAPLQAVSWGHPLPSGLPTVDLYLSGAALEAADADQHYAERLIRLPGLGVFPTLRAAAPGEFSTAARLWPRDRADQPVFIIPHTDFKLDPSWDDIYVEIAKTLGDGCQFVFFRDPDAGWRFDILMRRLAKRFLAHGLDPVRHLAISPWMQRDEFQHLLGLDVICLDPPAFSGFTTAWTALHRGTPIVTLEGAWLRQRLASGLMREIGVTDTVATDAASYVAIACDLATNPQRRAVLRRRTLDLIARRRPSDDIMPALEDVLASA